MSETTEKVTIEVPKIDGYKFKRVGVPCEGEYWYDYGEIKPVNPRWAYTFPRLVYDLDYSPLIHQLPELLPKSEFKNYVDVCKHVIVYYGSGTASVWNVWPGYDFKEIMNPLVIGFIPVKFKETK